MLTNLLPKITVIIPVLNCGDMLERAIESVLAQRYENLELIIMDGGSADNSIDIIKRYAHYIAYWSSEQDGSSNVAINRGIEKATGELIASLMADDWYEPGTLLKVGQALRRHPEADIISCGGRIIYREKHSQHYQLRSIFTSPRALSLSFPSICFGASAICCRFIRRSLYARIGHYLPADAAGRHIFSADKEFLLRAVLCQAVNITIDHLGYTYYEHANSATFDGNNYTRLARICGEHLETAANYLKRADLSQGQRYFLHYWFNDQSTRLLLYSLLTKRFRVAAETAIAGIQKYNLLWPIAFCLTVCKIFIKKLSRFFYKIVIVTNRDANNHV
ncbi:MAG: hypothetical protein A3E84_02650 [Gammaproteobacteria bacterium RIFCSPHIGHO2_12_FULL_42_13]|nr:MAG: hypothetical protein A3E84_02650 [Gammaproteobacteria bacterium RIFCSPHIGHO2_12_FULL_42_13]